MDSFYMVLVNDFFINGEKLKMKHKNKLLNLGVKLPLWTTSPAAANFFEVCAVMRVNLKDKKVLKVGGGGEIICWRGVGGNDFKTKFTPLFYCLCSRLQVVLFVFCTPGCIVYDLSSR